MTTAIIHRELCKNKKLNTFGQSGRLYNWSLDFLATSLTILPSDFSLPPLLLLTALLHQVEANLYSFVYATVAMNCTEERWEAIFQEYAKESLQSKQRYLMKALASTFNTDIIKKLLKYTMGTLLFLEDSIS